MHSLDHLSDEERKVYVIAHNHLNLEPGFDERQLLQQLQELQDSIDLDNMGIDTEKYISKLNELEKKELKPYTQVHCLVSIDINDHDKIVGLLEQLKKIAQVLIAGQAIELFYAMLEKQGVNVVHCYRINDNFEKHYGYFIA